MKFALFLGITLLLLTPTSASAERSFVTIVNPVRISIYTKDPVKSIQAEYSAVSSFKFPATWLLSYNALINKSITDLIKNFTQDQEIGLFMEVTPELASASGIIYDNKFSWHHPANIFLTGYIVEERRKLIDKIFGEFHDVFGYYPKSVGAWWIDAGSLAYMSEKYGIKANLGLADQYSTDGYRVWGTYWLSPYYPSRLHAGIPSQTLEDRLDIATIQWAPRDPFNGYRDSLYSTQDYLVTGKNLDTDYFGKLVDLYAYKHQNIIGHITIGLESDLNEDVYGGEYTNQLRKISERPDIKALTMKDFYAVFREIYKEGNPIQLIESDDLMGSKNKIFWYNSPYQRFAIIHNTDTLKTEIIDWRVYQSNFAEPYLSTANKDFRLLIDIPSVIDGFGKNNQVSLDLGVLKESKYEDYNLILKFEKGSISISGKDFKINGLSENEINIPASVLINSKPFPEGITFEVNERYPYGENGYTFSSLNPGAQNIFKSKKLIILTFLLLITLLYVLQKFVPKKYFMFSFALFAVTILIIYKSWYRANSTKYYASQSEVQALKDLSLLEGSKILVYDASCWGCEWNTEFKPAVFDNKREYVAKLSSKSIVKNQKVFEAKDQSEARREFDKTGADFIYVVNYEKYKETVPFSPGDLGIKLLYENANSQVWRKL